MMFFKTDEKSKGSGIGLYITKEAITKILGSISVQSQKNVGTTFTLRLPNLKGKDLKELNKEMDNLLEEKIAEGVKSVF
jgi:signal transduction histidine kinase